LYFFLIRQFFDFLRCYLNMGTYNKIVKVPNMMNSHDHSYGNDMLGKLLLLLPNYVLLLVLYI
jgi:hypothetical protein